MRHRSRITGALLILVTVASTAIGCGECTTLCGFIEPDEIITFEARLEQLGDKFDVRPSLFITADETPREVLITGHVGALEVGTTYIVNATDAGGLLRTSVPDDCSCGPSMTSSDGTEIDTSAYGQLFHNIQLTSVLAVAVMGFAALAYFVWRKRDPDFDEFDYYEDDWDDTGA